MSRRTDVVVKLRGRLGNQMFQLALGHILASQLSRKLCVKGNAKRLSKRTYLQAPEDLDLDKCEILHGHVIYKQQIDEAVNNNKTLMLNGHFQRYAYYAPYKLQITNLFRESLFKDIAGGGDSDIVFHLRTTDYRKPRVIQQHIQPVSFDYFRKVYESRLWQQAVIVTDDPRDELVLRMQQLTNAKIVSGHPISDFNFIRNSKNIVLSTSTFSWWAAWLSDANCIYFPKQGNFNPLLRPDIDLAVNEQRYNTRLGNNVLSNFLNTQSSKVLPKQQQLRRFLELSLWQRKKLFRGNHNASNDETLLW